MNEWNRQEGRDKNEVLHEGISIDYQSSDAIKNGEWEQTIEMMNLADTANSYLIQKIERVLHFEIRWKSTPMSFRRENCNWMRNANKKPWKT